MASLLLPAVTNLIFACGLGVIIWLMDVKEYSEMFSSSVQEMIATPWSVRPVRTLYDVKGPDQVYTWLTTVFINQISTGPVNGDEQGYCSESFQCGIGEGNAFSDEVCNTGLVAGDHNCPSFIEDRMHCCEPCTDDDCPMANLTTMNYEVTNTTKVTDLSANCPDELAGWLEDISQWQRGVNRVASGVTHPFVFCPERLSSVNTDLSTIEMDMVERPLMVGRYNRVLMGRLTLKRINIVPHSSLAFAVAYPSNFEVSHVVYHRQAYRGENTTAFEGGAYSAGNGYNAAGGFTSYLTFEGGQTGLQKELADLKAKGWFDLAQGSLVLEVLLFNGNIDKFLHAVIAFEHTANGLTMVAVDISPLDLTFHDLGSSTTYIRFFVYLSLAVLYIMFLSDEIADMTSDPTDYFSNIMRYLSLMSLMLVAVSFILYLVLVLDMWYISFAFPLPSSKFDLEQRIDTFNHLTRLALLQRQFFVLLSLAWVSSLQRLIINLFSLWPDASIVFKTFGQVASNLLAFILLMAVFMAGWTLSAYFLFGTRKRMFSDFQHATMTVFRMIMGQTFYTDLEEGDPSYGIWFFMIFHIFWLVVFQIINSIVILGFDAEKKRTSQEHDRVERNALTKLLSQMKDILRDHLSFVSRLLSFLEALIGSSDAVGRINHDEIARLKDQRRTKPRSRTVRYERKHNVEPYNDIKLVAHEPVYPNGLMHYYVDHAEQEGQAKTSGVQRKFRLVGWKSPGMPNVDTDVFRQPKEFERRYGSSTKKMLEHMGATIKNDQETAGSAQLDLIFEGDISKVTFNCVSFLLFLCIFGVFSLLTCRSESTYAVVTAHQRGLQLPKWHEYNPERIMSYSSMQRLVSLDSWLDSAVVHGLFGCYGPSSATVVSCDLETSEFRSNWALYARALPAQSTMYDTFYQILTESTGNYTAANGMSVGFIPAQPTVTITDWVRFLDYNIGVHTNNHVRVTVQVGCFERNPNKRWHDGYPFKLKEQVLAACADRDCMPWTPACFDMNGQSYNPYEIPGSWSQMVYKHTKRGSYRGLGGLVIGLGSTSLEAATVMDALRQDDLFARSVSMVLEMTTFNPHFDLFVYTVSKFSLLPTGKLEKTTYASAFPLTIFAQGNSPTATAWRQLTRVLFFILAAYLIYFVWRVLRGMHIQYTISRKMFHSPLQMPLDYLTEDLWSIVEIASCSLSIAVIVSIFAYIAMDAEFSIDTDFLVESWITRTKVTSEASQDRLDDFAAFQRAADKWTLVIILTSLCGFSLALNMIKYFGAIPALLLVMNTFASAMSEISVVLTIMLLMHYGFVVSYSLRFGVGFARYGLQLSSFVQLFLFLVGDFNIDDIFQADPMFVIVTFPLFVILFYMLSSMFLASIVYRWKMTRRDARDFSLETFFFGLYDSIFPPADGGDEEIVKKATLMDNTYWATLGILNHLHDLREDDGLIELHGGKPHRAPGATAAASAGAENGTNGTKHGHGSASSHGHGNGSRKGDAHESPDTADQKKIEVVFKRVHMEIASTLCRGVVELPEDEDDGAGVGAMDEEKLYRVLEPGVAVSPELVHLEDSPPEADLHFIPILDHEVEDAVKKEVADKLVHQLNKSKDQDAQEFLLDALVTVMERTSTLHDVQNFLLMPPILFPKKPQEKSKFDESKKTLETRLNLILRWLELEARTKHYTLLKQHSESKERVLKHQSLVLAEYLENLEEQIATYREEIQVLTKKTAVVRAHVTPLL